MSDTYRVIISPQAVEDLIRILDEVAKQSPRNAVKVIDRLVIELNSLAEFPRRYAVIEDATVPFDVRRMPIPPFRALYRVIEQHRTVEILTVRHGRQKS